MQGINIIVKGAAIWFVFQISAQTLAILTDMFWEFQQPNQANAGIVHQTHPWPFPSTTSLIHFSLIIDHLIKQTSKQLMHQQSKLKECHWNVVFISKYIFTPQVHKFSNNLGSIPKFWVPERRCEASSALRTLKHYAPPYKTCYPGNMAPNICSFLI